MSPRAPATAHELAQIALLAEMPGERLAQLAKRMRREEIRSGQAPVVEGDQGDRFFVIVNGIFAVSKQGGLGPRAVLRPGDYFGEVALAMHIPRTATVRALTPATVCSCDQATFDEFIRPFFAEEEPGEDQQFRRVR
jgi:ATP-binding cassette subfamily B protein